MPILTIMIREIRSKSRKVKKRVSTDLLNHILTMRLIRFIPRCSSLDMRRSWLFSGTSSSSGPRLKSSQATWRRSSSLKLSSIIRHRLAIISRDASIMQKKCRRNYRSRVSNSRWFRRASIKSIRDCLVNRAFCLSTSIGSTHA